MIDPPATDQQPRAAKAKPQRRGSPAPLVFVLASATACDGCKRRQTEAVAYTSVDQVFAQPILRYCERAAGISTRGLFDTEETKSTGVLNRLIAEAAHPQADVFWSGHVGEQPRVFGDEKPHRNGKRLDPLPTMPQCALSPS